MRLSFVTALYNCLPLTQAMYRSLLETLPAGLDYEIVFVDDGSTDGTREWLATIASKKVRVLLNEQNIGFAGSNNRGSAIVTGEVLALLNNDLVLQDGWLAPMLEGLDRLPRAGVIGNLQFSAGTGALDHRGVRFDRLGRPVHDQRPFSSFHRRAYSRYPAVTAACCVMWKKIFADHGGFDPLFHNGFEDVDLCLRLGRAGFRHYVANRSRVLHHVSASPNRHARELKNLEVFRNRWPPPFRDRGIYYLLRYWSRPWRFNGRKLCLALAWTTLNRECAGFSRLLQTSIPL